MGKKVLFLGDQHGRTDWREKALEACKKFQEIVFLGDYFDSFDISSAKQIDNFNQFVSFVRKKGGTALLGNHDYAYIHGYSMISGYQHTQAHRYQDLFMKNIDILNIAWGYTDDKGVYTLATHAGITQSWWDHYVLPELEPNGFVWDLTNGEVDKLKMHEILNFLKDKKSIMWKVGWDRGGSGTPGPLWADIRELHEDPYIGINQVIGHTASHSVEIQIKDNFIAKVDNFGKIVASLVISL